MKSEMLFMCSMTCKGLLSLHFIFRMIMMHDTTIVVKIIYCEIICMAILLRYCYA